MRIAASIVFLFRAYFRGLSEGREWGVGSVVVGFGVFGAPRFSAQRSQNPLKSVFWDLWTENRGAPETPNPTTTDPTPHSRPSEFRQYSTTVAQLSPLSGLERHC